MDEGLWELEEMVLKEFNVPVRPRLARARCRIPRFRVNYRLERWLTPPPTSRFPDDSSR